MRNHTIYLTDKLYHQLYVLSTELGVSIDTFVINVLTNKVNFEIDSIKRALKEIDIVDGKEDESLEVKLVSRYNYIVGHNILLPNCAPKHDNVMNLIVTGQSAIFSKATPSFKLNFPQYLTLPENRKDLYGEHSDKLIFSYIDIDDLLNGKLDFTNQGQLWKHLLLPIQEFVPPEYFNELYKSLSFEKNDWEYEYYLTKLTTYLKEKNKKLVLIVNNLEKLLHHPIGKSCIWYDLHRICNDCKFSVSFIGTTSLSYHELVNEVNKNLKSKNSTLRFVVDIKIS